jgi:NTE family protein
MGADIVIAVDVASSSEVPKEGPRSVADMLGRVIDLPLLRNTTESRPLADMVITPDLKGLSSGDFVKMTEIIPRGETAARADREKLSRWSVSPEEYAEWRKAHRKPLPEERPLLDDVVVDPIPGFDTRRITRVIATRPGLPFNEKVLQADMRRISGMALWQNVEFQLIETDGKNVLHIIATPKSWGPTYLSAGIDYEINASEADADWNLSLLLDATEFNRLGADWKTGIRLGTEIGGASVFYQPLDYVGRTFIAPSIVWDQQSRDIFIDEVDVARYRLQQGGASLDFGVQLGHLLSLGQFSVGVERGFGKARRKVGIPEFPDADFDTGGFHADLTLDQLDNFWFPLHGWFVDASFLASRTAFGADNSYNRAILHSVWVETFGRWTVTLRASYGDTFEVERAVERALHARRLPKPVRPTEGSTGGHDARFRLHFPPLSPDPSSRDHREGRLRRRDRGDGKRLGQPGRSLVPEYARRLERLPDDRHGARPMYLAYGSSGNKNTAVYLFLNRGF